MEFASKLEKYKKTKEFDWYPPESSKEVDRFFPYAKKEEVELDGNALELAQAIVHNYVTGSSVDVYRVRGTFTTGTLRGKTSSAAWGLNTVSDTSTMDNAFEDVIDNNRIETESDAIIDFTEHNPFGEA